MKITDVIKKCDKELVFELYSRLFLDYKDYDEITSNEMIEEISNFYSNPNNIINICTTKELKILKKILNKEITYQNYQNNYWEIRELNNKFLVFLDKEITIPKEFISQIEEALNSIDFPKINHKDELNEILIGIVKSFASIPLPLFLNISSTFLNKDEQYILNHINTDKLFQYYVYLDTDYIEEINEEYNTLIYQDYFKYLEDIDNNKLPCIVHFIINKSYKHFVVLYKIDNKKKKVILNKNKYLK